MVNNASKNMSRHEDSPNPRIHFFLLFAILLTIITIANNSLVVLAYKVNKRLRNRAILILVSLALSDFLVGAISMPLWIYMTTSHDRMPLGLYLFYMSFDIFSAFASILHLTWVSMERFLAIAYPLRHRKFGDKGYLGMLLSLWLVSGLVAGLFPVQYHYNWNKGFALMVFINGFILPLITLTIVYTSIYRIVNSSVFQGIHNRGTRRFQAEKKLAKTIITLCLLFFITWCPFFIVSLLGTFRPELLSAPSPIFIWYITVFVKGMHYSNSSLNTFVYAFSSNEMRKTFVSLLRCKRNIVFPTPTKNRHRIKRRAKVFHLQNSVDSV
ncbi:dopamine receptor 2-like [Actinia tenebrosa]|uniref:Dopamine receptor 2-like n=1 Tax=Actinia tenebrosa TaxID=6105 RepID=A0A6P8ICC1_ACTTE|nr:dopamine receptor 2-like [Actinia tenebrosa]